MPFSINPDLIENNDVEIQTVDGELALFHKPSGNTLIIDEDTSVSEKLQSPLSDDVDFDGNDLNSGGDASFEALEAESVSTDDIYTSNLPIPASRGVNLTEDRSKGTVYQNTTGSTLSVFVRLDVDDAGDRFSGGALVGPFSSLESDKDRVGFFARNADENTDSEPVKFLVPPDWYYQVQSFSTDDSILGRWLEKEWSQ